MKKDMEYLTDAELDDLIRMVEQEEILSAPPDLKEQILGALGEENIIAFRRYRFRVLTTVAAAVLVIFLLPKFESLQQHIPQEEVRQSRYATKEEALNDKGILNTLLGGVNIFADNSKFNLFRE
ncbi:MAG: hypothetical protein IKV27_00620 [Lachnospiraceae bacterium]|nr:hypothetical protein [Lachnospiraceae bacterium]